MQSLAQYGLRLRYRHYTALKSFYVTAATNTGIWERDSWNNHREMVVVHDCPICVDLSGSNHNSVWVKATLLGATDTHLKIGAAGSIADGNKALLFSGCDIEFGGPGGKGATIAPGAAVTFNTCYLGENIKEVVIENEGHCLIRGGTLFFGDTTGSYGIRPLGGRVLIDGAQLSGQTNGSLSYLINLSDEEVDAGSYGRVELQNVESSIIASGVPTFNGDVLDYGPSGIVFAPRLGKSYTAIGNNATNTRSLSGNSATFTASAVGATNPIIGATGTLNSVDWRDGEALYLLVTYTSTKPLVTKVVTGTLGARAALAILPVASRITTALKLDAAVAVAAYTLLQFTIEPAVNGDTFTLHEVCLADSRMTNAGAGVLGNLYKC